MNNTGNEKGSSLLFIIVLIMVFGVLCGSMISMFTSSTVSVSTPNYALEARYMAEAGIRYARAEIRNASDREETIKKINKQKTYTLNDGNGFELAINASENITSIGFAGTGSSLAYMELKSDGSSGEEDSNKDDKILIRTIGDISIGGNSSIVGGLNPEKNIKIGGSAELTGDINAGENVEVSGYGKVDGDIFSGGKVTITGSRTTRNVNAVGDVERHGNVIVGNITTTGDVTITGSSHVLGTINAGGNVIIKGTGSVDGNIIAGGYVSGSVDYETNIPLKDPKGRYIPARTFPDFRFTAGEEDPDPCKDSENHLDPGRYRTLKTSNNCNKFYFKPGKYYFEKIDASAYGSAFYLELPPKSEKEDIETLDPLQASEKNDIAIFVVGDATFGWGFKLMISDSKEMDRTLAKHLYIETRGNFESSGQWLGAVYSWGKISLHDGGTTYAGLFYTKNSTGLNFDTTINIVLEPSNYIINNW